MTLDSNDQVYEDASYNSTQHDAPILDTQLSEENGLLEYDSDEDNEPLQYWATLICNDPSIPQVQLANTANETDSAGRCNETVIGRGIHSTVCYNGSPRVSNNHCRLYCKMNNSNPNNPYLEAFIEDLSANGTFINRDTKLVKNFPRKLHSGEDISLVNPELIRAKNSGVTQKDIAKNSFVVVLHVSNENKDRQLFKIGSSFNTFPTVSNILTRSSTVMRLLNQNRNIQEFYDLRELLGTGTSGSVFRAVHKSSGVEWAVKTIDTRRLSLFKQDDLGSNRYRG